MVDAFKRTYENLEREQAERIQLAAAGASTILVSLALQGLILGIICPFWLAPPIEGSSGSFLAPKINCGAAARRSFASHPFQ
jgi:hypothetical protein